MVTTGAAEHFIETSGCGPFQVILLIVLVTSTITTISFSVAFMSFGNYNPGWRCMDNITTSTNMSGGVEDRLNHQSYTVGSCDVYDRCQRVEFNPDTSTVVTEWGLLCDKAWMSSVTLCIQMAGMVVFSFIAGQLADTFGRKKTLYASIALCGIVQLASAFSSSLALYTLYSFFICGLSGANLIVVLIYVSEFMTIKWRAIIVALPFWHLGGTVQSIAALVTKDWRQMQLIASALHVLCFIPVFWVPESLRWLEVKRESHKFKMVSQKIVKLNKPPHSPMLEGENVDTELVGEEKGVVELCIKKYTLLDIFRPGYVLISICLGLITFVFNIVFSAMTFGVKSFYGDFYLNLIVTNAIAIPIFLLALLGVHFISRKRHTFLMLGVSLACVVTATGLLLLLPDSDDYDSSSSAKSIGSTALICVARATVDSTWFAMYGRVAEIYPTVVRGITLGYVSVTARAGGVIAPFIIPEDKDRLYIFTVITASLIMFCCLLNVPLPETKGKPLKEDFGETRHHSLAVELKEQHDENETLT